VYLYSLIANIPFIQILLKADEGITNGLDVAQLLSGIG
jgi:hypothetical protein